MSWPLLATPSDYSAQTQGLETSNYPTVCSPPSSGSYAAGNEIETSLYRTSASNKVIDAELDTLLSELAGLDSQPSTRHSSDSFQTGASPSYTPQSTLESQVYLAEHPYSPLNSDCSDDVYEDSAYSSPVGSVDYRSVACSPHMPASDWSVQNSAPAPTICPVTSTAWFSEQQAVSGSGWLPHFSSYEQGPPMTPTVSELLLDRASYFWSSNFSRLFSVCVLSFCKWRQVKWPGLFPYKINIIQLISMLCTYMPETAECVLARPWQIMLLFLPIMLLSSAPNSACYARRKNPLCPHWRHK